jgi:FkbM family methyltransferase
MHYRQSKHRIITIRIKNEREFNMKFKQIVRKAFNKMGYDIAVFSSLPMNRRRKLIENYKIDLVLDVGANVGQYAKEMRRMGYKGKIISFEPLSSAFKELHISAKDGYNWDINNYALGDFDGYAEINIANNSFSSSILNMSPSHMEYSPESRYIGTERIEVKRLDTLFDTFCHEHGRQIWLKIDTQGFEKNVLAGAEKSLKSIDSIQIEMSLIPLYENELLFDKLCGLLYDKGYRLVSVEPGFYAKETGQMLQIDGIFHRFLNQDN